MPLPYGVPPMPGLPPGLGLPPAPRPEATPGRGEAGRVLIEATKMILKVAHENDHLKRALNPIIASLTKVISQSTRARAGALPPGLGGPAGPALNVTPSGGEIGVGSPLSALAQSL